MFNYLKTLQKRKVIGLVSGYVLLAWIIMQVLEVMIPAMRLPEMLNTLTAYVLVMLFPFVALAAWMWDFKRAEAVAEKHGSDAARKDYSEQAKRQLNILIAGGIVLALTLFVVNRWVLKDSLDTVDAPVIASVAVEAVADAPETLFSRLLRIDARVALSARSRSLLVAATSRTSALWVWLDPTRSKLRSPRNRSNLTWTAGEISPISSRNRVPPSAI